MAKENKIISVDDNCFLSFNKDNFKEFNYQKELTEKLDGYSLEGYSVDFNQEIINEIVLWKVNRYAKLPDEAILLINKIDTNETILTSEQKELVSKILNILLKKTKGIQLPMASTILRFRNKNIFQIIDQRVYRILYREALNLKPYKNDEVIEDEIKMYFNYLDKLREKCQRFEIPFSESDRILYEADKYYNKDVKLKNY